MYKITLIALTKYKILLALLARVTNRVSSISQVTTGIFVRMTWVR